MSFSSVSLPSVTTHVNSSSRTFSTEVRMTHKLLGLKKIRIQSTLPIVSPIHWDWRKSFKLQKIPCVIHHIRTTPPGGRLPRRTTPPEDVSPAGQLPRKTSPPEDVSPAGRLPGGNNNNNNNNDNTGHLSCGGVVLRGRRPLGEMSCGELSGGGDVLRGSRPAGELSGGSHPRGSCPPGEFVLRGSGPRMYVGLKKKWVGTYIVLQLYANLTWTELTVLWWWWWWLQ